MKHSVNISAVSVRHLIQSPQFCGTQAVHIVPHSFCLKISLFSNSLAPWPLPFPSFSLYLQKTPRCQLWPVVTREHLSELSVTAGAITAAHLPDSEKRAQKIFVLDRSGLGVIPESPQQNKTPPWLPEKHLLNNSKRCCSSRSEAGVPQVSFRL